jgi:hypothetical protein
MTVTCNAECTRWAVKKFAWKLLPFANGEYKRTNAITGVSKRSEETAFYITYRVLHTFSCSISEVRKADTSERKNVLEWETQ